MYRRRMTDKFPKQFPGSMIILGHGLCITLLLFTLTFLIVRCAAAGTITLHATQYDPLKGTSTYQQALDRIQYAGTSPYVLTLHTTAGQPVQGILDRPVDHLHYYCQAPNVCRLDTTFTTYIPGRVFAAGFEK